MSQYQPNAAPSKSFISKINSKFSSLSLGANIQNIHTDKDGDSANDTLIHNAFTKYFESKGLPWPEWLGPQPNKAQSGAYGSQSRPQPTSQYQPVRANYNSQQQQHQQPQFRPQYQGLQLYSNSHPLHQHSNSQETSPEPDLSRKLSYTPRTSRLLDLYNKSRQQSIPGSGYNAQPVVQRANTGPSAHSQRVREKMLNSSPSMNNIHHATSGDGLSGSKATWGRR